MNIRLSRGDVFVIGGMRLGGWIAAYFIEMAPNGGMIYFPLETGVGFTDVFQEELLPSFRGEILLDSFFQEGPG